MAMLSPFLCIDSSCDQALQTTRTKLSEAGLSAVQTFNLNTARLGLHNCCCPYHGTEGCDCQMIILLVYGEVPEPATLIFHGNNRQTWISIADSLPHKADTELVVSIRQIVEGLVMADP